VYDSLYCAVTPLSINMLTIACSKWFTAYTPTTLQLHAQPQDSPHSSDTTSTVADGTTTAAITAQHSTALVRALYLTSVKNSACVATSTVNICLHTACTCAIR
jgi:hypothetical protein